MRAWRTWQKLFAFLCVVEHHLGIFSVVNFLKLGFRIKMALACKWHLGLGLAPVSHPRPGWLFLLVWLGGYFDCFGVTSYCLMRFWVWHNESLGHIIFLQLFAVDDDDDDDDELFFCGMIDWRKAFSLIFSQDHCQRPSPLRISDTPQAGFNQIYTLELPSTAENIPIC